MSEISIVCPDCADQAGRLCDKIERLQSQLAKARKALHEFVEAYKLQDCDNFTEELARAYSIADAHLSLSGDTGKPSVGAQSGGAAASRLEPLATRLREATVYCTQMQSLESQCLAVAQELELLARDLSE